MCEWLFRDNMDTVSPDTRNRMMSMIRSCDTKLKMLVRKFLWRD